MQALRVAMPFLVLFVVSFFALAGSAHAGVLLHGAHDRRFSTFKTALGTIVEELLAVNSIADENESPVYLDARAVRGRGPWVAPREMASQVVRLCSGAKALLRPYSGPIQALLRFC